MRAIELIESGAKIVKPLDYYPSREKASGRMWGGDLTLEKDGITYHFEMWHHGGDEMSPEQALENVSLKGITKDGKYYDTYWYTLMDEDSILLYPKGWFRDKEREEVCSKLSSEDVLKHMVREEEWVGGKKTHEIKKKNYNFARDNFSPKQEKALQKIGFIKIVSSKPKKKRGK